MVYYPHIQHKALDPKIPGQHCIREEIMILQRAVLVFLAIFTAAGSAHSDEEYIPADSTKHHFTLFEPETSVDFLYGVDWIYDNPAIFTLNTESGEITKYYGHPVNDICALDFDSNGDFYVLQTSALWKIDLLNPLDDEMIEYNADWTFESFEIIGDVGYAAHVFDGGLYMVDLSNGDDSLVGYYGSEATRLTGLASNDLFGSDRNDVLYAARVWQQDIVTVDPATAAVVDTVAAGLGYGMVNLAYGSDNTLWYIASSEAALYSVDITTGEATLALSGLDLSNVTGLTAVPDAPAPWPVITTDSLPDGAVGEPYGPVQIEVQNGEPPFQWMIVPDEYEEIDLGTNEYAWRGDPQFWWADDGAWIYGLPFDFPFYGDTYRQIWVCSNGFIDLDSAYTDPNNSNIGLIEAKRICPMWDDLSTSYGGRDIYIDESVTGEVTVFWNAFRPENAIPCYFQCTLHSSGAIEFHYGPRSEEVTPTVGISNGDGVHYAFSMYNGQSNLEFVNSVRFRPDVLPEGLSFSEDAVISGTPAESGTFDLDIRVIDSLLRSDAASLTLDITD